MANQTEVKSWPERGLGGKPGHKPLTVGDELLWLVLAIHVAAWVWAVNLFCCTSPPPRIQNDGDLIFGFHKLHIPYHWRAPEAWPVLEWSPAEWPEVVELPMPRPRLHDAGNREQPRTQAVTSIKLRNGEPKVVQATPAQSPYDRMPIMRGDQ